MKTTHKIILGDSRRMSDVEDSSVHLVVTSPPYPMIEMWDEQFKKIDPRIAERWAELEAEKNEERKEKIIRELYGLMHDNLTKVWAEVYRVLIDGGIACINIGDATRRLNGIFRLLPNHATTIETCEKLGFVTLPYVFWKKPTNKPNAFLGSGFLPTSPYVTLDCESILIFRKGGVRRFDAKDGQRLESRFTKKERDVWCSQIWEINGEKQSRHDLVWRTASYPEEIPHRLIRMHSIIGDTVLDPFLGTGTTAKVASELKRNSIGYEINEELMPVIKDKIGYNQQKLSIDAEFKFVNQI